MQLGFVGVVLRSQEDIANRRSMADARAAERAFFEGHPEYLEVAGQVGVSLIALPDVQGGMTGRRSSAACPWVSTGSPVHRIMLDAMCPLPSPAPRSAAWATWRACSTRCWWSTSAPCCPACATRSGGGLGAGRRAAQAACDRCAVVPLNLLSDHAWAHAQPRILRAHLRSAANPC